MGTLLDAFSKEDRVEITLSDFTGSCGKVHPRN